MHDDVLFHIPNGLLGKRPLAVHRMAGTWAMAPMDPMVPMAPVAPTAPGAKVSCLNLWAGCELGHGMVAQTSEASAGFSFDRSSF